MKRLFHIGLIGAFLSSCSPATPPVPPAELPALIFPRTVRIDTSKIQSRESSSAALVGSGGTFSEIIAAGADLADATNELLDAILGAIQDLSITISASTTTFQGTVTDEAGTFNVKIDFADFDLDGDGDDEGCSGHTATLPICFRVWLDGERFMAGKFNQYPTETNPGSGEFRIGVNSDVDAAGEDLFVATVYDHSDSEDKTTELFMAGFQTFDPTTDAFLAVHIDLHQEGPDATARKTINANADTGPSASQTDHLEYIGRYLENADFWGGSSRVVTSGGTTASFTDACAVISTGNEASDPDSCEDLDIDVGGVAFTDPVTVSDIAFPSDFPSSPTF